MDRASLLHLDSVPVLADGYTLGPPPCIIPPQAGLVINM